MNELRGLPVPEECNLYNGMTLEILMKKAAEWDKVVTNPDYIDQTENAIRELRKDNILYKAVLALKTEAFDILLDLAQLDEED